MVEIWPMIIEKALAKAYLTYENLYIKKNIEVNNEEIKSVINEKE